MKKILKFERKYRQLEEGRCGPNAMGYVLFNKYRMNIPEKVLANMSCCSTKNGASIEGMVRILKKFNINYELKYNSSIDDLIESINKNHPVILFIQAWGNGHYMVVRGYNNKKEKIIYYDPFDGGAKKEMHYKTLNKNWYGWDSFHCNRFGIFFKD